jgi:hypothetical protein
MTNVMKTRSFLVCCAALALGSGCATYDSGGTGDDTTAVSGSGYREFYYAAPEHREYTWKEPWNAPSGYREYNYVEPHKDYFGAHAPAVWKQPSPNGQDWTDARPEFLWYRNR